jgi:hypothetical protein
LAVEDIHVDEGDVFGLFIENFFRRCSLVLGLLVPQSRNGWKGGSKNNCESRCEEEPRE